VRGIGIEVTSFLTILGSAGVALGLALQGSLSNLAGGLLILLLKPYRVGDYIKTQAGNQEGTVISIDIFYTKLRSVDNQMVVIPNGELSNNSIVNVTKEEFRRVDVTVDIAYDSNLLEAKNVLSKVCEENGDILLDKGLDIFVNELGESGIMMGVHAWVRTQDYWTVRWSLLEQIKLAFDAAGIQIPYKTVDINIVSEPPKGE
jgi:small conductance mechanosensitive channel